MEAGSPLPDTSVLRWGRKKNPMKPVIVFTAILSCAAVPALAKDAGDRSDLSWMTGAVHAGRVVVPTEPSPETEAI